MNCMPLDTLTSYLTAIAKKIFPPAGLCVCFTSCLISTDVSTVHAGGPAPRFEIDMKDLDKLKSVSKPASSKKRTESSTKPDSRSEEQGGAVKDTTSYTVKPGDFLFKILIRDFGMSNRDAELRIPEVMRINNLASSTRLTVGQKLVIPAEVKMKADRHTPRKHSARKSAPEQKPSATASEQPAMAAVTPETAPLVAEKPESVPVAPAEPAIPAVAKPRLSLHSVSGADLQQNLDTLLNALSVPWDKDRVIEGNTAAGSPESFSIKVERYLELDGRRYVLTGNRKDPYEYTILRILQMSGYTILRVDEQSGIPAIATQILTQFGFTFTQGKHRFTQPDNLSDSRIIEGVLVTLKTTGSRAFITETPLDAVTADILSSALVEPLLREEPATISVVPEK